MAKNYWTYVTSAKDMSGDGKISPEYITDDDLALFQTPRSAFSVAYNHAEEEAESLNEGCSIAGRHFGVPLDSDYDTMKEVKVVCYFEDERTEEIVTRRTLKKVVQY